MIHESGSLFMLAGGEGKSCTIALGGGQIRIGRTPRAPPSEERRGERQTNQHRNKLGFGERRANRELNIGGFRRE